MLLRAANSVEAPRLVEILVEGHARSRYADHCQIDEPLARKILAHAIHKHGGTTDGASFVNVAEDSDGIVQAFIFGSLGRIYGVGDKLCSCDNYLIGTPDVNPFVLDGLFKNYVDWARDNPKVIEVGGSWANTIPGSDRFAIAMQRRGFFKIGETFALSTQGVG